MTPHDGRSKARGLAALAAELTELHGDDAPRLLTGAEAFERLEEAFGRVRAEPGHGLAVAWRLARALGAAQGHLDPDSPLSAVPERAWRERVAGATQGHTEGTAPWIIDVASASVGLGPTEQTIEEFGEVVLLLAARLGIRRTRDGRLGLGILLELLEGLNLAEWPEPWKLVAIEDALVLHTFEVATCSPSTTSRDIEPASEVKAARMLREEFGLTEPEVASVLALAHRRALDAMPSGQDSLRALQYHALEDLSRRAAAALDLRSEIAARRLLAQVSGVTRTEPEDLQSEFLGVVRKIAAFQDTQAVRSLPAPNQADTRLCGLDGPGSDPEDLDEFEQERSS